MKVQTIIETKISEHFSPTYMELVNESFMHNVAEGSESHFKLILVAQAFEGSRLIGRHRAVNKLLQDELATKIHALALHTYTPDEWIKMQGESPNSPNCMGGKNSG
jgi:BolA protein